jgi:hypothetical protein
MKLTINPHGATRSHACFRCFVPGGFKNVDEFIIIVFLNDKLISVLRFDKTLPFGFSGASTEPRLVQLER